MMLKIHELLIFFPHSFYGILTDATVNMKMEHTSKRNRSSEIYIDNFKEDKAPVMKKMCTCSYKNQDLNEPRTSKVNENIIIDINDMSCISPCHGNSPENNNNSSVLENVSEVFQSVHRSIKYESKDNLISGFNEISTSSNKFINFKRNATITDCGPNTSANMRHINNTPYLQSIPLNKYNTSEFEYEGREIYPIGEISDNISYISMLTKNEEAHSNIMNHDNINDEAINSQVQSLIDDFASPDKIISFFENIDDIGGNGTTNIIDCQDSPSTNIHHEDSLKSVGNGINLTENETDIFNDEEVECCYIKDKQTTLNTASVSYTKAENMIALSSSLIGKATIANSEINIEELNKTENYSQVIKNPPCVATDNPTILDKITLNIQPIDRKLGLSSSTGHGDILTLNDIQPSKIHIEEVYKSELSHIYNKNETGSTNYHTPLSSNMYTANKELDDSEKNHNIPTMSIFVQFSGNNEIIKEDSIKHYEFRVLYERTRKKYEGNNCFNILSELSPKNAHVCPYKQILSKQNNKKILEDKMNSVLQSLYFDQKTCIDIYCLKTDNRKGIFVFNIKHDKIKYIPKIKIRRYSSDCICNESKYFKHSIYYFTNLPLYIYPYISVNGQMRFWSINRLHHGFMFNFILSICVEKNSSESLEIKWGFFDFEKRIKQYISLFMLRLNSLYITILERVPEKKISLPQDKAPVVQMENFYTKRNYVSLNGFLGGRLRDLIGQIKTYTCLITQETNGESIRSYIYSLVKFSEEFYTNYTALLNYINTSATNDTTTSENDTGGGLILIEKMLGDIIIFKFPLILKKNFSSEELELMSFCNSVRTKVANFIKLNTPHISL